ncbi:MAG: hypothetical protein E8D48_04215 [Nitrospira sp.]|nr:MAG: hypothetical protein E8D48_04215 [Nitrospira sp.]
MNGKPVGALLGGLVGLLVMGGCASEQALVETTSASPPVSSAPSEAAPIGPSDSLKACLTKISSDSSEGARMVAEQSCQDSEKLHQGIVGTALAKSANRVSAGTQGDSMNACIALIPTSSTVGQRMLAEETCARDQLTHH